MMPKGADNAGKNCGNGSKKPASKANPGGLKKATKKDSGKSAGSKMW